MDNFELECEEKVKEISIGDGCIYVDLLSGLRLSGPLLSEDQMSGARKRPPRRMIVSGHEGIVEQALAFG
jgi:hypothetical protein